MGAECAPTLETHLADVQAAAEGRAWAVARDAEGLRALAGREDLEAVLLPAELADWPSVCHALSGACVGPPVALPPVVAVLIGRLPGRDAAQAALIDKAHRALVAAGADAVIFKIGGQDALEMSVEMCLTTCSRHKEALEQQAAELKDVYEKKTRRELDRQQERFRASRDHWFWRCAHRVFPGDFPELDETLPAEVDVGASVGLLRLDECIGAGKFGTVYSATDEETGQREAVKAVAKAGLGALEDVKAMVREMRLLQTLEHEHVVQILGASQGPRHIFISLELVGSLNLFHMLASAGGRFSPEVAKAVQAQLCSALAHCHGQGVGHRDIKAENVAAADESEVHIKLIDFGHAVALRGQSTDVVGSLPFMAPEVATASKRAPYAAAAADAWSSGIVLQEMLCGSSGLQSLLGWATCQGSNDKAACEELRGFFTEHPAAIAEMVESTFPGAGEELLALVAGLLTVDPARRWTAEQAAGSAWLLAASGGKHRARWR